MTHFRLTDQDYRLWWLILLVRRAMYKAESKELFQYGLTHVEASVLFIIQAIGYKATPAEISRWILRESHSVSGLLDRMEKEGLVRKVKDLDRKNLIRVELTEKGCEAYNLTVGRSTIHQIMSALSQKERQQLEKCLQKLFDEALKELGWNHEHPFSFPYE